MARYAIVRNGTVDNIVNWDGDVSKWTPPANVTAVQTTSGMIGDTWDGIVFTTPDPVPGIDLSNLDNLEKTFQAMGLLMRQYCNALLSGTYTTKTVANVKADFSTIYKSLNGS